MEIRSDRELDKLLTGVTIAKGGILARGLLARRVIFTGSYFLYGHIVVQLLFRRCRRFGVAVS